MVVTKTKKVNKYRSHTTHGGGHRKKRRGAGSRGGRGNAGSGKRASHKVAGSSRKLGPIGFTSKRQNTVKAINLGYFDLDRIEKLLNTGKIKKEGDLYLINLNELGYNKLLGTGKVNAKLEISVNNFTSSAEEKIKEAGGKIVSVQKVAKKEEKAEVKEEKNATTKKAAQK
jgi:large subunit ribosomal protein L15